MARKGNPISVRVKVIFSLCLLYFIFHFPLLAFFIRLLGQIQKHIAVWGSHWPFALKLLSSDLMVCGLITTSSEMSGVEGCSHILSMAGTHDSPDRRNV